MFILRFFICICMMFSVSAVAEGIDHKPFDDLLRAHVKNGQVDYPAFQNNAAFDVYVEALAKPATLNSKSDKLVYYINAYNALAIKGITDGYSPNGALSRTNYFFIKKWTVNGQSLTLDGLEKTYLKPVDSRIHVAVVCASKSCPKLISEAFTGEKLEELFEQNSRGFANDASKNSFDKTQKVAKISQIFEWHEKDFVRDAGSVQKWLAKYVTDPDIAKDLAADAYQIEHLKYDWSLNGTAPKK
ncbi:MAG: hypothetical protein RL020_1593 [Pseudomonadota bacterium]|jgi:Protein of unknown function, DUF547